MKKQDPTPTSKAIRFSLGLLCCGLSHGCAEQKIQQIVQLPSPAPAAVPQPTPAPPERNHAPVIQALTANPTQVVKAGQDISLNVKVFDSDGDTLDYTWSATLGLLSATKGSLVTWSPTKLDGSAEASGVGIISLLVSDNRGGQDKADINIQIQADGSAKVTGGLIESPPANNRSQE